MTKKCSYLFALSLAFIAMLGCANVAAQNTVTGDWKATLAKDETKINLNFERHTAKGHRGSIGQTYDFSELGLTREQVINGGPVRFSLVREAGTIACEGNFQDRKGAGTFTFTPSASFVANMKSRGFDFEKDSDRERNDDGDTTDRLFSAAALNVTTALADDLASAGFSKLTVGDLFKAAIFHIDSAFMREMKATGFPNLDMQDLVKARIFHINADFVRQAAQMGFAKEGFESLVKMSIFKVTPDFVTEVRNAGLNDLSVEDVVKLRIFHIDGDFIRKAKADGTAMDVQTLVQKKLGVGRAQRRSRRVII
jgi:hypothetical protein